MKHIALYLGIAAALAASCDKTPVQDDTDPVVAFEDETFKAYCLSNFDKDGDGEISLEEAEEVTSIVLKTTIPFIPPITSLRGIESFTNLVHLDCSNNLLTSLDLSQNTALEYLDCSCNPLTGLNVGKNTALTRLYCYSTQLTSLDVSGCTKMETIVCNDNRLTVLDVSGCPGLSGMECQNNPTLSEIWLKSGQTIPYLVYDESIATIKYI